MQIRQCYLHLWGEEEDTRQSVSERVGTRLLDPVEASTDFHHDRYVEMLEHQQTQLVNGLQELYKIATSDQGWEGPLLADGGNGRPLTHDILHSLGVLHSESQSASTLFDEDLDTLQQRLISDGADMVHPRESPDSDYEKVPTQVTFDVGRQQRPTYRNPFAISQLPTPPMLSPSDAQSAQEFMWQTSVKPAQIRSQSLQIHPGHLAWGGVSMNPAILQSRAWAESPLPYEASSDSLGGEGLAHFVNMDVGQQQVALAGEATMPDWIEDDYVSFLDTPLS